MQNIAAFLPQLDKIEKSRITSERQDIIRQFMEAINKERVGTKYKPLSPRAVACLVGHLKDNHTLYYFLSQCNTAKKERGSFSKCFFGALKVR